MNEERLDQARRALQGEWTSSQVAQCLEVSNPTADILIREWRAAGLVERKGLARNTRYRWVEADAAPVADAPPPPPRWSRRDLGFAAAGVLALVLLVVVGSFLTARHWMQPVDRSADSMGVGVQRAQATSTTLPAPTATPILWGTPMPSDVMAFYAPGGDTFGVLPAGTEYQPQNTYGDTAWLGVKTQQGDFWVTMPDMLDLDMGTLPNVMQPTPVPTPVVLREYIDRPVYVNREVPVYIEREVRVEVPVPQQPAAAQPAPPPAPAAPAGSQDGKVDPLPAEQNPCFPYGYQMNGCVAQHSDP